MIARAVLNSLPEDIAKLKPECRVLSDGGILKYEFLLTEDQRLTGRRHIVTGLQFTIKAFTKPTDIDYSPTWDFVRSIKKNNSD